MEKSWRNITIGLAGVLQASLQVEKLAKTGYLSTADFETAVASLFQRQADTAEAVYGGLAHLTPGLEMLIKLLEDHRNPAHGDILRYTLGLFHLQKKLAKRQDMLQVIATRLEKAQTQAQHFGSTHDNVVSSIAEIYTDTISTFTFRIQVTGEYNYLHQARVSNQVRVLLLAGVRAATLWRQASGSRWQLLMSRNKIAQTAHDLLREARRQQPF